MSENVKNVTKKLICVKYPAVVNNVDKALETIGGINALANASEESLSIRLRFHPDNLYEKPIYGNSTNTAGLLIKVKIKRNKRTKEITSAVSTVVGRVDKIFEFKSIFDFQYLPVAPKHGHSGKEPGDLTCILDQLIPQGLPVPEWLNLPAESFLQPVTFSRTDTIHHIYSFQDSTQSESSSLEQALKTSYRESRQKPVSRIFFSLTDEFPDKLSNELSEVYKSKTFNNDDLELIKSLFEEHPIWQIRALMYHSKLKYGIVNAILPFISILYLSGPWRRSYIKLGYDPRKNPQARIYQTVDFRLKNAAHLQISTPRRRGNIGKSKFGGPITNEHHYDNVETNECSFIFKIGHLPPKKQMLYQFCHIQVPMVEEMLARLPALLPGALCHEKTGWLPSGFEDSVRDVLTQVVNEEIKKRISDKSGKEELDLMVDQESGDSDESDDDVRDEFDDTTLDDNSL